MDFNKDRGCEDDLETPIKFEYNLCSTPAQFEDKIYNFRNTTEKCDGNCVTVKELLHKIREYYHINMSKDLCLITLEYRLDLKSNEVTLLRYEGDIDPISIIFSPEIELECVEERKGIIKSRIEKYINSRYPGVNFKINIDDDLLRLNNEVTP